jgi:PAS domain S-box-containing protein
MSSEEGLSPPIRVLVVAGRDDAAEGLTHELRRLGHRVTVVTDGDAAIAAYLPSPHPLVVLDDRLEGRDGIALARRLRGLPGGPRSAILAVAASADAADLEAVLQGWVDDWLIHPINLTTLDYRLRVSAWRAWERQARARTEEDLRKLSGRLAAVLDASTDPIVCLDEGGSVESFNAAAEALFGYQSADVLGRSLALLMPSGDGSAADLGARDPAGAGHLTGRRKDGSTFPFTITLRETPIGSRRVFTLVIHPRGVAVPARRTPQLQVRTLVESALASARTTRECPLNWNVAASVPERLSGDAVGLENLLADVALRAAATGAVSVDVAIAFEEASCIALRFIVRGAKTQPPRDHEVDDETVEGWRAAAEALGGEIGMQGGAALTWWFTVPLSRTNEDEVFPRATPEPRGEAPAGVRVLVAEDVEITQRMVAAQLSRLGCAVHAVSNGREVLEALARESYELVLMDCRMPVMDGFEATRRIRDLSGRAAQTRIVALTASASDDDRERCLAAGMDGFLAKPVGVEELRAVLEARPAASTGVASTAEAIDRSVLESLREELGEALPETLTEFLWSARRKCSAMRVAIEGGDTASFTLTAHSLRGSSGSLGARALSGLCERLETSGRNGDLEYARAAMPELEIEIARLEEAIGRHGG